jgi:hypothetical protein
VGSPGIDTVGTTEVAVATLPCVAPGCAVAVATGEAGTPTVALGRGSVGGITVGTATVGTGVAAVGTGKMDVGNTAVGTTTVGITGVGTARVTEGTGTSRVNVGRGRFTVGIATVGTGTLGTIAVACTVTVGNGAVTEGRGGSVGIPTPVAGRDTVAVWTGAVLPGTT